MPTKLVWLIFLIPFFGFIVNAVVIRPFFKRWPQVAGYVTIAAIGTSLVLSLWLLREVLAAPGHRLEVPPVEWVALEDLTIRLGVMVDALTAVMVVTVSLVSLLIQIYSQGYMHGDPGYIRYFAFMSLFTGFMLGLVMAENLLFLYFFWEGVGLCSYLLIGFWFHRPSAANAAKKAFIVTRLGDFGFLLGILYLYTKTGTFSIPELHHLAATGALAGTALTWGALGIFAGAVGKSAQFPLHVWLPDAMEGPTPVSALIHAATMVAAGAFLVARTFPLFEHSETALTLVAYIGGFTALFAATMGLVMTDIKRVVAYSTISQLGYMMLGLGAGNPAIAIFHLFNHAFFKALLFLGAGSVNHATGTFDMREMGGLRKYMPWTALTFLVAALSLAGIWPLSGFWSKDEILARALETRPIPFYLGMVTVFLTACYIFRAYFMTFSGEYRGKAHHLHESPKVMLIPMLILGLGSIVTGWFNVAGGFSRFLGEEEVRGWGFFIETLTHPLPWLSLILAGLGIFVAYAVYGAGWASPERIRSFFGPLHRLVERKYYFDDLYERVFTATAMLNVLFRLLELIDVYIVDGLVNGVSYGMLGVGQVLRRVQVGQLQFYGLAIALGLVAIFILFYYWG